MNDIIFVQTKEKSVVKDSYIISWSDKNNAVAISFGVWRDRRPIQILTNNLTVVQNCFQDVSSFSERSPTIKLYLKSHKPNDKWLLTWTLY